MIIRKLRLETFGGVQGRVVEFVPGLNVVLGPNEAGKSTMVNALFASLFLPTDSKKNSREWKEYLAKFLPVTGGDTIAVTVEFLCREGHGYTLSRSWGESRLCRLAIDGGGVFTSEDAVQQRLADILGFGRGTYEGVLFARQDEMLRTVSLMRDNREAANTLGEALRAALFEAGGVSLDELAAAIEDAKKDLLHYWDVELDGPKGNRGIDRPYKNGGRLLEGYYQVEHIKRRLRVAREAEERLEAAMGKLEAAIREKAVLEPHVTMLEGLDNDIRKRSLVEAELLKVAAGEVKLKEINAHWPKTSERLSNLGKQQQVDKRRLDALEVEWQASRSAADARVLRQLYSQALPLVKELQDVQAQLRLQQRVSAEDITWLESCVETITRREAQLQAMKLTAKLSAAGPLSVAVTSGLGQEESVQVNGVVALTGEGRLRISAADWSLEVQAGQEDVDKILEEIRSLQGSMAERLKKLEFTGLTQAKEVLEAKNSLHARATTLQARLEGILGDKRTFEEVESSVAALPVETQTREADVVLAEKIQLAAKVTQDDEEIARLRVQITQWEQEFGSHDDVMDNLADLRGEAKKVRVQLAALAVLPEAFASTDEFFAALATGRARLKELDEEIRQQKDEIANTQRHAPQETVEELAQAKDEAEIRLQRLKKEANAILEVEAEFWRVTEQIDSKTFTPFVEAFVRYLAPATGNRYTAVGLEGALPERICTAGGSELPVELLSTGTTRGVALALRLAMAEFLLEGAKGFMVMDDPLVDLDPGRKEQAAKMVRDYAQERQMIITTCDPETARMLGGTRIEF